MDVAVRGTRGRSLALAALLAAGAAGAPSASAQCQFWSGLVHSGSSATDFASFDEDGAGPLAPSLFVGGSFTVLDGIAFRHIARLRGGVWSTVGTNVAGGGLNNNVTAMAIFDDDGPGPHAPALYVSGAAIASADGVAISGVAKWDGVTWSSVGPAVGIANVSTLFVYDADGSGPGLPVLLASGTFTTIAGTPASHVAAWNGVQWTAMDGGSPPLAACMAVFDEDGAGPNPPTLFAGGPGSPASTDQLFRWDGAAWAPAANQPFAIGGVNFMIEHDDDGPGPAPSILYCAQNHFVNSNAASVRGRTAVGDWFDIGPFAGATNSATIQAFAVYDPDGPGPGRSRLFAGFTSPAFPSFLEFDGNGWAVPADIPPTSPNATGFGIFDDGSGLAGSGLPALFVGLVGPINAPGAPLNGFNMVRLRSDPAFLSVSAPPYVFAPLGAVASFEVSILTGSPVIGLQWRRDGVFLTDGGNISGAATERLIINPITEQDRGIYECIVTSNCSTVVSRPSLLDLPPPPDPCPADTNGDHTIDFIDLNNILSLYGMACP